jgi:hypothetical protein
MSMKNSNDNIGNRTRDFPTCSAVPQPTAPPCTPVLSSRFNKSQKKAHLETSASNNHYTLSNISEERRSQNTMWLLDIPVKLPVTTVTTQTAVSWYCTMHTSVCRTCSVPTATSLLYRVTFVTSETSHFSRVDRLAFLYPGTRIPNALACSETLKSANCIQQKEMPFENTLRNI